MRKESLGVTFFFRVCVCMYVCLYVRKFWETVYDELLAFKLRVHHWH